MDKITSRAVIGYMKRMLSQDTGASWINYVANRFNSDQASEEYTWLGASPAMQEWIGQRQAKGLPEYSFEIKNKHYEATIEVPIRWMNRDKFGMIEARVSEMAQRANAHWAKLLSTLIINGESTACYDGQYFFDTDHSEGSSGTQSNDISVDVSAVPVEVHGTTTIPSVEEMQIAIFESIQQMVTFKDDQGEPINEAARDFLVMVPPSFIRSASQAVNTTDQVGPSQTAFSELKKDFSIHAVPNVRLSSWTTKFAVFRTDAAIKPFIMQDEKAVSIKAKAEGSDYEFDNDAHQYGLDAWRNVGYGRWQNACLVTLA